MSEKSISQLLSEYNTLGQEKLLKEGGNFKPRASFKDRADAVRSLEKLNQLIKVREESLAAEEAQEEVPGQIVETTSAKEEEKKMATAAAKKKPNNKAKAVKSATPRRSRFAPDQKISLLVKDNPRREGTDVYKQFELARKHKTVGDYIKAGGRAGTLQKGVNKKWLKVD